MQTRQLTGSGLFVVVLTWLFSPPLSLGLAFSHLQMRSQFGRKYGSSVFAIKTDDLFLSLDVSVVWVPDLFFIVGSALQL